MRLYRKVKERRDRNLAERGYEAWLFGQLPGEEELKKQREEKISFSPLISILVPAYETPEVFLRQMIDSVLEQSYGKLELCIADGSPSDRVRRTVERMPGGIPACATGSFLKILGFQAIRTRPWRKRQGIMWAFWIMTIYCFQGPFLRSCRRCAGTEGSLRMPLIRMRISWIQSGAGISSLISSRILIRSI